MEARIDRCQQFLETNFLNGFIENLESMHLWHQLLSITDTIFELALMTF